MMHICPQCGSIMLPKKIGDKTVFQCSNGHILEGETKIKETVKQQREVEVVENEVEVHPKTKAKCPKCGNMEAYYWEVQTRSPDEAATVFFRCTRCKHQWREYK